MPKRKIQKKKMYQGIRRKHLKKLVVAPIMRCIKLRATEMNRTSTRIWKKLQSLEDGVDILAREFQRRSEQEK